MKAKYTFLNLFCSMPVRFHVRREHKRKHKYKNILTPVLVLELVSMLA